MTSTKGFMDKTRISESRKTLKEAYIDKIYNRRQKNLRKFHENKNLPKI